MQPVSAAGIGGFLTLACKGVIAVEFGRDPRTMTAGPEEKAGYGLTVKVSYRRPDDGTLWEVACREAGPDTDGSTVVEWTAVRERGSIGRWRNDPKYDDHLRAKLEGRTLTVVRTYRDGGETIRAFPVADLQPQASRQRR